MADNKKNVVLIIIILAIINMLINIAVYWWGSLHSDTTEGLYNIYGDVATLIWSIFASVSFILVINTFKFNTPNGKAWFFLGIGLLLWTIGDIIFAYYDWFLPGDPPFPSVADYAYTAGYPMLIIGMILQIRIAKVKLPLREILIVLGITIVIAIIELVFLVIPMIQYPIGPDFTISQLIFSIVYPIGDTLIAPFALLLIFKYKGGEFAKVWFIIAIGFLVAIFADFVFSLGEWNGVYPNWWWVDLVFIGYYMLFAIGSRYLVNSMKK